MRVSSLFIEPDSLLSLTEKLDLAQNKQLDLVKGSEVSTYWTSLGRTESKHTWMQWVKECITRLIPNEISITASYHLDQVMEDFVDTKLIPNVSYNSDDPDQGISLLALLLNIDPDDISDDTSLSHLADEIQECFNRNRETRTLDDLHCDITCLIMTRFLERVSERMEEMTPTNPVITLYYCLYVEQTDSAFSFLKGGYLEDNLIPIQPDTSGVTLSYFQLGLAELTKQYYGHHPMLENGVLRLLAGVSNVIRLKDEKEAEITLAANIMEFSGKSFDGNQKMIFLTLHKFILYLTFNNLKERLPDRDNKFWSVAIVLDCLNEAVRTYKRYAAVLVS